MNAAAERVAEAVRACFSEVKPLEGKLSVLQTHALISGTTQNEHTAMYYLPEPPFSHTFPAHGGFQSFEVAQGFEMARVFRTLEKAKAELGLENYTLSQTNLEQVFLNIAEKQFEDDERGA